ncbi:MAG: S24/S26 family peptidase [Lachnospiraceae bacterium]
MENQKKYISSKILFSAISEQLAKDRQAVFTVTGMSMWPFLCHGRDQVIVEKAEKEYLKIGDIVLFLISNDKYILHRVTQLSCDSFQSTGDGNIFRDGWFPYESIVAKVGKVIRNGKVIDCNSREWETLSWIWMRLFRVRKWLFFFWFKIRKIVK